MIHKLKEIAPEFLYKFYLKLREKHLAEELQKLKIKKQGIDDDGTPYIQLDSGIIFHGFLPSRANKLLHESIENEIPFIQSECFKVAYEIVDRYVVPRCIPGESYFYGAGAGFKPLRDPLNDLKLSSHERKEMAERFKVKSGSTIIDAGAFTGFGTIKLAERSGDEGRVFAFESFPDSLSLLRKNIEKNGIKNVTIVPKAVSNFTGTGTFYTGGLTANSLTEKTLSREVENSKLNSFDVEVTKIDDELKKHGINSVDYINITVNGAEPEVIEGASELLRQSSQLRLTTPGWYYRESVKLHKIIVPQLMELGLKAQAGRLGRVLAWKD